MGNLSADIEFDPAESLSALQELTKNNPQQTLRLGFEPRGGNGVDVSLTDGNATDRFERLN